MKVLDFPLSRITIVFVMGLLFANYAKFDPKNLFVLLTGSFVFLFFIHLFQSKRNRKSIFFGFATIIISFLIGISTYVLHKETNNKKHYLNQIDDFNDTLKVNLKLVERLKSTQKNERYIAKVVHINNKKSSGRIILNIKKDSVPKYFMIGTSIKSKGVLYRNKPPLNPDQFDYGKYLENQEIYAQFYAKPEDLILGKTDNSLISKISNLRIKVINNLIKGDFPKKELSIVNALILGQRQDISQEVLKDYQYAGAVHILAVSGLHVGIILYLILLLLKPIPNNKYGSKIKLIISLTILWLFGILAGLSPSVIRAVTMFSFIAIGLQLRRTINIYHSLLVSILIILLFEPNFIYHIGFQLSYLAVFFILWFQPLIANIWNPKNKILKYMWDIITVSFAAQIGVLPLSLYYFNQFPGLFIITNLLILPLLSVILSAGIIVVVLAALNFVPFFTSKILILLIQILNFIVHWVASFDNFIIKNISFSIEYFILSYLIIVSFILWFKKNNPSRLAFCLCLVLYFQTLVVKTKIDNNKTKESIVFNFKKESLIANRNGRIVEIYSTDSILKNLETNINIQSYLNKNFCTTHSKRSIKNFLTLKNKKILIIDSSSVYLKNIQPEIVILRQSPKINLDRMIKTLRPKQIIADGSNYKTYIKRWQETCKKEKIPFHNTNEKGYYKI